MTSPLFPLKIPAQRSLAPLSSFPGPGLWLRDPGAPREECDQPGFLREPGREPSGDGAGQGVPTGADPHRQPPALVRVSSFWNSQNPPSENSQRKHLGPIPTESQILTGKPHGCSSNPHKMGPRLPFSRFPPFAPIPHSWAQICSFRREAGESRKG